MMQSFLGQSDRNFIPDIRRRLADIERQIGEYDESLTELRRTMEGCRGETMALLMNLYEEKEQILNGILETYRSVQRKLNNILNAREIVEWVNRNRPLLGSMAVCGGLFFVASIITLLISTFGGVVAGGLFGSDTDLRVRWATGGGMLAVVGVGFIGALVTGLCSMYGCMYLTKGGVIDPAAVIVTVKDIRNRGAKLAELKGKLDTIDGKITTLITTIERKERELGRLMEQLKEAERSKSELQYRNLGLHDQTLRLRLEITEERTKTSILEKKVEGRPPSRWKKEREIMEETSNVILENNLDLQEQIAKLRQEIKELQKLKPTMPHQDGSGFKFGGTSTEEEEEEHQSPVVERP